MWHERLRKQEELNTMTVMLQKEVDKYKVLKKKGLTSLVALLKSS